MKSIYAGLQLFENSISSVYFDTEPVKSVLDRALLLGTFVDIEVELESPLYLQEYGVHSIDLKITGKDIKSLDYTYTLYCSSDSLNYHLGVLKYSGLGKSVTRCNSIIIDSLGTDLLTKDALECCFISFLQLRVYLTKDMFCSGITGFDLEIFSISRKMTGDIHTKFTEIQRSIDSSVFDNLDVTLSFCIDRESTFDIEIACFYDFFDSYNIKSGTFKLFSILSYDITIEDYAKIGKRLGVIKNVDKYVLIIYLKSNYDENAENVKNMFNGFFHEVEAVRMRGYLT